MRLDQLDPAALLHHTTTAAVAALARGDHRQRAAPLTAAAELITARADPERGQILLGAAATLASIVLSPDTISTALKEAAVPIPVRDTPLGRLLYEEGLQEGLQKGQQEALQEGQHQGEQQAVLRLTRVMLSRRFGHDDPRLEAVAAHLAGLPDDERLTRLTAATGLEQLAADIPT